MDHALDPRPTRSPDVLVVDDDDGFRRALARALRHERFAVAEAPDGEQALALVAGAAPAVVVLDVAMPRLTGIEVTRRIRASGDNVPILVLLARDAVDDRVAGLSAGADDYLVKPFAMPELVARLHALLRRRPGRVLGVRTVGSLRVDAQRRLAWVGGREIDLTMREFDLLEVLAHHAGMVLTRQQLLQQVWGYTADVQTNVVDVFVGYLRRKLEVDGEPRMIHTVRGHGFVLRAADT